MLGSAMASMKAEQEEERAQLQAAIAHLQQSSKEDDSLRAELAYLAERIALMQGLREVGQSMHHQRHI